MTTRTHADRYRWVVLAAFMLVTVVTEIQWLTHAPVARAAAVFYAGQFNPESIINIDALAMTYMLAYLVVSIPASYIIGRYGIRVGIGIGSVIVGVASLLKGFFAASFTAVLWCQIALAVAQPFILNPVTALTVRWFPLEERGLAAGFAALAQYVGIIIAMVVTPLMVVTSPTASDYGAGIDRMLIIYGVVTAFAALIALLLIRERPEQPVSQEETVRHGFSDGLRHILRQPSMVLTIALFFIGLGIFNAISSMVDSIAAYLGVVDSDGLLGGIMLVGGVIGAVVLPALSDRFRVRKPFLVASMAGMLLGVALLTFASAVSSTPQGAYVVALAGSFVLGFFVMSAGPIGFQYAAEISLPAPESTSQGLLLLSGQISGLVFVAGMSVRESAYLSAFLRLFVVLSVIAVAGVLFLRESPLSARKSERLAE